MTYLLDSNVLSELWKSQPNPTVLRWFYSVEWILPSPIIAEIQEGAESAGSAARRLEINARLDHFLERNPDTVAVFDAASARAWGRLKHSAEVKRQPQPLWDSLLDAMAVTLGATIATRNTRDFRHAKTFNPFSEDPPNPASLPP